MFPEIVSWVLSVAKILSVRVFDLRLKRMSVVICGTREDEFIRWRKTAVLVFLYSSKLTLKSSVRVTFLLFRVIVFHWDSWSENCWIHFFPYMDVCKLSLKLCFCFVDWLFQWNLTQDFCFYTSSSH